MARKNIGGRTDLNYKEYDKITRVSKVDRASASSCRTCGRKPVPMGFLFNDLTPVHERMVCRPTMRRTVARVELHIYRTMREYVTALRRSYNERTRLIRTTEGIGLSDKERIEGKKDRTYIAREGN